MITHFGDPCIHCGIPHDEVPSGACRGDTSKARVLAYCIDRQAWENPGSGAMTVLCKMTTGQVLQSAWRPFEMPALHTFTAGAATLSRQEFRRKYGYTVP